MGVTLDPRRQGHGERHDPDAISGVDRDLRLEVVVVASRCHRPGPGPVRPSSREVATRMSERWAAVSRLLKAAPARPARRSAAIAATTGCRFQEGDPQGVPAEQDRPIERSAPVTGAKRGHGRHAALPNCTMPHVLDDLLALGRAAGDPEIAGPRDSLPMRRRRLERPYPVGGPGVAESGREVGSRLVRPHDVERLRPLAMRWRATGRQARRFPTPATDRAKLPPPSSLRQTWTPPAHAVLLGDGGSAKSRDERHAGIKKPARDRRALRNPPEQQQQARCCANSPPAVKRSVHRRHTAVSMLTTSKRRGSRGFTAGRGDVCRRVVAVHG